jgi:hypothetical protein
MIFTNPSGKKSVVSTSMKKCDLVTTGSNDNGGVVECLSILPYDFSLNSDKITSKLLIGDREKQRRDQRNKLILQEIFN